MSKKNETAVSSANKVATHDLWATKLRFEEVEIRRMPATRDRNKLITTFERLKVLRSNVKISQYQADILNTGRTEHPSNNIFAVYLLPGQELEPLVKTLNN